MRRSILVLGLVLVAAAGWWLLPRAGRGEGVDDARGAEVTAESDSNGTEILDAPALTSTAAAHPMGAADEEPAPRGVLDEEEGDEPPLRRLRVVSEADREGLVGVTVSRLGSKTKERRKWVTDRRGEVIVPGLSALRCRFSLEGFVATNVGQIGTLKGDPIVIVLRPLAHLYGRTEIALAAYTPTADNQRYYRRRAPKVGILGRVMLDVDRRRPYREGTQSNYRGILSATRRMADEAVHVQADGTWSLFLEIPSEINALEGIVVEQVGEEERGGRRTIGTVSMIEPGQSIEVFDTWASAEPLNLRFVPADGAELSPDLRFLFRRTNPEGFDEQIGEVKLDRQGRVPGVTLALGSWNYSSSKRWRPNALLIEGVIEHRDDSEQVIQLPAGGPLTVVLARSKGQSGRDYRVGIALAGEPASLPRYIRSGEEVIFPFVPAQGSWELVILKHESSETSLHLMDGSSVAEVQRLPISVDQRRIELNLP